MNGDTTVSRNCREFLVRLEEVANRNGRDPATITVVAVSKTRPLEDILAAVSAGMSNVGESKVQEAQNKLADVPRNFRLHMIGHLQTNKVRAAVGLFDLIESVDSLKLARAINDEAESQHKVMPILLEINCSREEQKYGLQPEETEDIAREVFQLRHLRLCGLMTVAPFVDQDAPVRAAFVELYGLLASIKAEHPGLAFFDQLSMGMSDDWEIAVAEGSTMIRIGRTLFGER
jgi:pyridoxal phosphate enzyme (YggS family)